MVFRQRLYFIVHSVGEGRQADDAVRIACRTESVQEGRRERPVPILGKLVRLFVLAEEVSRQSSVRYPCVKSSHVVGVSGKTE